MYVGREIFSRLTFSLLGNGNHEAKYAGLNQGSQRILPCRVSINRPAWPRNVISKKSSLSVYCAACDGGIGRKRGHPAPRQRAAALCNPAQKAFSRRQLVLVLLH